MVVVVDVLRPPVFVPVILPVMGPAGKLFRAELAFV
jgi:hypothetical protein